ncbi:hypothetical protein LCGC14_2744700, partial [marine sediment metagenome]
DYYGNHKFLIFSRDITERKQSDQKLQESEELYKALVRTSPDAIIVSDLKGIIIEISQRAVELSGFKSIEDIIGKSAFDFIAPEDHEKAAKNFQKTFKNGILENVEYKFLKKDGGYYIGELNTSLIKDIYRKPKSFITTIRDITERKKIEQKLKESEKKYRHLFETSPMAISLINPNGVIVDCNSNAERIFGYKKSELIGSRLLKISAIPKKNIPLILKKFKYLFQDKISEPLEIQLYTKEKESIWVHLHGSLVKLNGDTFIQFIVQDITDRKVAEQKLIKSEKEMSIILENIPELIVFQDLDYNIIRANKVAGDSVSTPPEELVGRKCFNVWYNKNLSCKNCPLDNTKKTKQSTVGEKKGLSGNIYKIGTYPVFDGFNNMTGIIEVAQDITEQRFAEQKLKESEEKFRLITSSATDAIIMISE